MQELGAKPTRENGSGSGSFARKQRGKLAIALGILLVLLVAIVVKDREFWFPSDGDSDAIGPEVASQTPAKSIPSAATPQTPAPPAATVRMHASAAHPSVKPKATESAKPADSSAVVSNRMILPPMDVEVVAGDTHHIVHPGSSAARVEITKPGSAAPVTELKAMTNAAANERFFTATVPSEQGTSVVASYPLLAQQMKVQGSVVLQAVIGADGIIENLRVVSGPAILASAAQQAVRDWHFKPYVQNGQPVETQARITVNFTIRVADSTVKAS